MWPKKKLTVKSKPKNAKSILFKIWQQCDDEKVKDSEDESFYKKDDEHSDEDKETSVDKSSANTVKMNYKESDYDEM